MAMTERPEVRETIGGKCWEHTFEKFHLKVYVPDNDLDGLPGFMPGVRYMCEAHRGCRRIKR